MFTQFALLGMSGGAEWIIILIVALLIFGSRLPQVMRNLGRSMIEFKKGMKDVGSEVDDMRRQIDSSDEITSKSDTRQPAEDKS